MCEQKRAALNTRAARMSLLNLSHFFNVFFGTTTVHNAAGALSLSKSDCVCHLGGVLCLMRKKTGDIGKFFHSTSIVKLFGTN